MAETTEKRRLGILGGSFNPIHYGHLIVAERACEILGLCKVLFVPAKQPPHKCGARLAPARHRCNMVRAAIEDNPRFKLSTVEVRRRGLSYSIETVRQIKQAQRGRCELFFIIGADMLPELPTWKSIRKLARMCRLAVAVRPGFSLRRLARLKACLDGDVVERMSRDIIHVPPIGISSSEIRARVAEGLSIKYLVPPAVEEYIVEHGLFRNG